MGSRVLIVHYTPPGVIGGVEHIMQQHIELLTSRGYDVEVAAGRADSVHRVHVVPYLDVAGTDNIVIETELAESVVSDSFHTAREAIVTALAPLFSRAESVIVHNAYTLHFSLPFTAALWELGRHREFGSIIAWCHDLSWTNPLYLPGMHDGYPWFLLRTPAPGVQYVTVSDERRRELVGLWGLTGQRPKVVPNGVDASSFLRLSPATLEIVDRYDLFNRGAVLLLPVRITRRKNIEAGLHAVRSLRNGGLDVCFLISGPVAPHHPGRSQTYLQQLKALRRELGLESHVAFLADELGRNLDHHTIAELYTVADALLFPSAQEGFGLPILEAGLARIPAIVSDLSIFREVGAGDVWTFSLQDTADRIAGEIMQALDSRTSRLHRRVLTEYRWDAIVERHIEPLLQRPSTFTETPHG